MSAPSVEIEVGGHALRVEYEYSPGRPGRMYLRNGDPGYPDEPPGFAATKIELRVGPHSFLDITDLIEEVGGLDIVDQLACEAAERAGVFDPPEGPEEDERPREE